MFFGVACGVADALITPKTVGGIANVLKSLQRLEAEETLCADKKIFTDPKLLYGLAGSLAVEAEMGLWREGDLEQHSANSKAYFSCGGSSHCSFVSPKYAQVVSPLSTFTSIYDVVRLVLSNSNPSRLI